MGKSIKELIKRGSLGELVTDWQKFLKEKGFYQGIYDGDFGPKTEAATQSFQQSKQLVADGIAGKKTLIYMFLDGKLFTEADFETAAIEIGCEIEAIKAVAKTEAPRSGFFIDGKPKILFEAHKFHKHTAGKYDKDYPNISSRIWNKALYKGGEKEYLRLDEAKALNKVAAYKSASWGKFQILGENFRACGFTNVLEFVDAMRVSEGEHLLAFINFVKSENLDYFLISKDWAKFARGYNGPGYAKNQYDVKMAKAYNEFKNIA